MLLSITTAIGESPELNPVTHTSFQTGATAQSSTSSGSAFVATELSAPSSYDLRAYGDVTSVKSQGNYGTCWAFATYASLESSLLKASNTWTDFSERNLAYGSGFDWGYNEGGSSYLSEAYLSRFSGPVSESDDPYSQMGTADNVAGPAQYYIREMLRLDTPGELKTSLMAYGAAYTYMYWDSNYFRSYDCTYYYNGPGSNHAVTIVGWDDSKATAGGTGAWLVKNSWGTGWADSGYFWLAYQDSGGRWGESFCDAAAAGTYSRAYYHDTFGDVGEINTPYAFNKYVATSTSQLKSVGFFTAADDADYTINVYDTYSAGRLSNLMATVSGSQRYAGYHTVDLASAVPLTEGNDFYVSLQIANSGTYCMAIDYRWDGYNSGSSAAADQSYYSFDGTSWTDLTTWNSTANFCIKALVQESEPTIVSTVKPFHGDFNGDGTDDILWQNQDTGLVGAWIINNGQYTRWASIGKASPTVWRITGTGDFNGDGTDDILWQNRSTGQVVVWTLRNGELSRSASIGTAKPTVWNIAGTGDFDGNGTEDILLQNRSTGQVTAWILRNSALSRSAKIGSASPTAWNVAGAGDLDGNGTDDILWQNRSTGQLVTWILRNGAFSRSASIGSASPAVWNVAGTGDFDGNGTDDILLQNRSTGQVVAWILQNGTYVRSVSPGTQSPAVWSLVAAGDYDGDGTSDILWQNQWTGLVGAWSINGGECTRWAGIGSAKPTVWRVAGTGDFNGDGTDDVLWQNQDTGLVGAWIIRDGQYTRWAGIGSASPAVWRITGTGDFNGDGTDDILWQNRSTGQVVVWTLRNGELSRSASIGTAKPTVWNIAGTGDFDGNGTEDILLQNRSTGQVTAWILRNSALSRSAKIGSASPTSWNVAGTGDFDGNGTDDILWQNRSTGQVVAWILRNGAVNRSAKIGTASPAVGNVAGIGDCNGDGTSDILWRDRSTGQVAAWILQNGVYTQWANLGIQTLTAWNVVAAGDYDGDGTSDILWQDQSTGIVGAWILQNGQYTRWAGMETDNPTVWQVAGGSTANRACVSAASDFVTTATGALWPAGVDPRAIVARAAGGWGNVCPTSAPMTKLARVESATGNLGRSLLATTVENPLTVGMGAAGCGCFVDPAPSADAEYTVNSSGNLPPIDVRAVDRIDLPAVAEEELGRILSLDVLESPADGQVWVLGRQSAQAPLD